MRFICWNVNGLRAVQKKGKLGEIFAKKPDIFAINETKCTPEQLPRDKFAPAGYEAYFDSATERKGYSGVAVYTTRTPNAVERGLGIKEMDHEGRLLTLHFDDFVFVTCYFPNGGRDEEHFQFKLRYYEAFIKHMKKLAKTYDNVIFCGDMNVAHNEIDLARPKENSNQIGFLPVERAWVDKVESAGFADTFRTLHPNKIAYSWWDQKTRSRERNVGWRIDYFFVNQEMIHDVVRADILADIEGSDHAPVLLELKRS